LAVKGLKGGELFYNFKKYGRYPTNVTRYFFKQVVDGIAHMHQVGYCHRDLKPWNVMLSDDFTEAKIIDFSYSVNLDKQ